MLDPSDPNHRDWRGIACVMNLNSEEVKRLENDRINGKMKGLIERMIQKHKTVNDLLTWLRHPDVERLDVIDEIRKEPNTISDLDALLETESSESQQSGLFLLFASSVEVCFILFKNVTSHACSNPFGESAVIPPQNAVLTMGQMTINRDPIQSYQSLSQTESLVSSIPFRFHKVLSLAGHL